MIFSTLWYFANDLPDYKVLSEYKPPVSSRVYSADGDLIAEYAIQKRLFVPFESIPKKVINAFLSAEDKNFFKHPGIDAKGIVRAIIKNINNSRDILGLLEKSPIHLTFAKKEILQAKQLADAGDPFSSIRGLWAGCAACHGQEGQGSPGATENVLGAPRHSRSLQDNAARQTLLDLRFSRASPRGL